MNKIIGILRETAQSISGDAAAGVSFLVYFDGELHPIFLKRDQCKKLDTGRRQTDEGWESVGATLSFDGESVTFVSERDGSDCDGRLSSTVEMVCHKDKLASVQSGDGRYLFPEWVRVSESQRDYAAERAGY